MFLRDGKYDFDLHHNSHLSVGVPGTVAGLHLAWKTYGTLPWPRLVEHLATTLELNHEWALKGGDSLLIEAGEEEAPAGPLARPRRWLSSLGRLWERGATARDDEGLVYA